MRYLIWAKALLAVSLILFYPGILPAQSGNHIVLMSERIKKQLLQSAPAAEDTRITLASMSGDSSWPDINYRDRSSATWQPGYHLDRVLILAKAYSAPGHAYYKKQQVLEKIKAAIAYWLLRQPSSGNYWWMGIGGPIKMGELLMLLEKDLPKDQKAGLTDLMRLGIKKDFYDYHGPATGQNLVWLATVHIYIGILEKDTAALHRAFYAIHDEVTNSKKEGIKYDNSFHQHGAILYSGGYGLGFSEDIAKLIVWSHGTPYAFPADRIAIFSGYVLDGQQWMIRGRTMDYSSMGREIARKDKPGRRVTALRDICLELAALSLPRQKEFRQMADRLSGKASSGALVGNRYFPRSDFMVHHTPLFYSSVKTASSRMKATETGNNENLKGYNLGQGVQFIFRNGTEYDEIFPVWDWRRLPGLLCEQTDAPYPLLTWGEGAVGARPFTGGVTDGSNGMAVNDYARDNVSGRRAWFYFNKEIICMGAAISCLTDNNLYQSVNQSLLRTGVMAGSRQSAKSFVPDSGRQIIGAAQWIWQDSVAYLFTGEHTVTVSSATQTGSWKQINNNAAYSDSILHKKVFSAWIDLGTQVKDAKYLYAIVPGLPVTAAAGYPFPVKVVRNDSLLQAVWHPQQKMAMAAFYRPGELVLDQQLRIKADKPVLLMLKETGNGYEISLSNPLNRELQVNISINRKLKTDNSMWMDKDQATLFSVELPGGPDAGKTVRKQLLL